jgi:hypothetical protein
MVPGARPLWWQHVPPLRRLLTLTRRSKMNRPLVRVWALAFLGAAAMTISAVGAAENEKKEAKLLTIEEIMKKAHGKGGTLGSIAPLLKATKVDWEALESKSKELSSMADDLAKNKPEKGEAESWEKHTKGYKSKVEDFSKAVKDQDVAAATKAQKSFFATCMGCHKVHR